MNKGTLICFMGIDGSGKTTIAKLFKKRLQEKHNIKVNYVWCKFGTYNPWFYRLFYLVGKNYFKRGQELNSPSNFKNFKDKIIYRFYMYFLLINHYLTILKKVKFPLLLGRTVICDRYLPDTLVDLVLEFDQSYEDANGLLKMFYFTPTPDLLFYIRVPVEVAYKRKKENSSDYLNKKMKIYDTYAAKNQVIVLDGTKDLDDIIANLHGFVRKRCLK